ncbi:pickpocket protein 28-like [Episyrphus balteatus]|uniref:pickpocket protein 28-like n=1 Tax=Episyrphus balteatus TaxID=286459 RepID=UPI0024867924|nr:pickpocket protein 28-like [Episyrphus balteatus]
MSFTRRQFTFSAELVSCSAPKFEIIWLIALIFSIISCGYLISIIWYKRDNEPVIVTLDGRLTPIWEIPFPTITICPEIKTYSKIINFTKIANKEFGDIEKFTEDHHYFSEVVSQTCQLLSKKSIPPFFDLIPNSSNLIQVMSNAAPKLDDVFLQCHWTKNIRDCNEMFVPVLTEQGICFAFNSIKLTHYLTELYDSRQKDFFTDNATINLDWDLQNGYTKEKLFNLEAFPFHTPGDMESVKVILIDKKGDEDHKCRVSSQGFKLILRVPGDEPQMSKKFVNVPFDQKVSLTIKSQIMTTSEGLRHYSPERRQCYYQNERYLRFFTVYTQANCEMECQANTSLFRCGCVKFSMPKKSGHAVCGIKNAECFEDITKNFGKWKFMSKSNIYGSDNEERTCIDSCLPTCFDIKYKAEIEHQVPYDHNYTQDTRLTEITIKFEDDVINGLTRSELYSTIDFIANCGGLLGLFMGVSVLSVFEILYFFTIRVLWNLKSRQQIEPC